MDHQTSYVYDTWFQAYQCPRPTPQANTAKLFYYGVPGSVSCNPTGGTQAFTGNRFGQVEKAMDANSVPTTYGYDDLGRVTSVLLPPHGRDPGLYVPAFQ